MGENKKCTSCEKSVYKKNLIEDLAVFLKKLPYDFRNINSQFIVDQYKKEIIRVK